MTGKNWGKGESFRELQFHNYHLVLLNALMNSPGVFSLITDKSPVAAESVHAGHSLLSLS